MNLVQRIEHWGERHHPRWADLLRMALGVFLCIKGIEFANNMSVLPALISDDLPFSTFMLALVGHYIVFAHLLGGFLLAVGLLTRFAAIIQIPVLMGAILFVNWDMMQHFSLLIVSLGILLLLIYFMVVGSGPWSLDKTIKWT